MTDLDERLAEVLRDAVPQPPHTLDGSALRAAASTRTPRWRLFAPALAAAAVAAVVVGVLLAVHHSHRGSNQPAGPSTGGSFEARPLLMPAISVTHARPNPFAGVSFRIPSTEAGYGRLTAGEQQQLLDALRGVDCANPPELPNSPDRVVCERSGSTAALVGPPILNAASVASAVAKRPQPRLGVPQWSVVLTLTRPAARAWHAWTSAHHADTTSVAPAASVTNCGPSTSLLCSDYVAFIVGDRAVSIPVNLAPLDRVTEISGDFDKATATRFAKQLTP